MKAIINVIHKNCIKANITAACAVDREFVYRESLPEFSQPQVDPKSAQVGAKLSIFWSQKVAFRAPVVPLGALAIASWSDENLEQHPDTTTH